MTDLLVALLAAWSAILTAILGWFIWRTRRDFIRTPGAFRCNVRLRSAHLPGIKPKWSRTSRHAMWVHTVLVIRGGLLRPRIHHLPARMAEGSLVELRPGSLRRLGRSPVSLTVQLDDNQEVELAAAHQDRALLVGPFVVAAVGSLPDKAAPESR
jgi:hypothetical protein